MSPLALAALVLVAASAVLLYRAQEARLDALARHDTLSADGTRRLEQLSECVIASAQAGVVVVDSLGTIESVNAEGEQLFGARAAELVGRSIFTVPAMHGLPALVSRARRESPPAVRTAAQHELELLSRSGTALPLGVCVNALLTDDQQVSGWVLVCRDLTLTKARELDAEHSRKLTVLGTVASGVAHNFNNILTTVLGRVQLLIRFPQPPEKLGEILRIIEKSALDGAATVKRIQDYTKREQFTLDDLPVDVNEIVSDVVAFTRARWQEQAREKGLTYDVNVEPGTVRPVRGSSSELREVLINLMLNAIDAMPKGGKIRIATETGTRHVRIRFIDDGPGMEPAVKARIFDPFFTTKGRHGTGLGLFESANIVQRHRGRLTCDSEPGRGTTFTIELPSEEQGPAASAPPAPSAPPG